MPLAFIRGRAMTWYYLCDKCQNRLFKVEERPSTRCTICNEKTKIPEEMILCSPCSFETKMCMGCGSPVEIGDSYEDMREKALVGKIKGRRRKAKKKK